MKEVFEVKYKCLNCSNIFSEKYEKGDRIVEHWNCISLESHNCTYSMGCDYCRTIICKNCDSSRDIKIIERNKLKRHG